MIISFKATFIFPPTTPRTAVREVVKVQGNGVDLILDERVSLAIQICELDVVTVGQEQFSATDVLAWVGLAAVAIVDCNVPLRAGALVGTWKYKKIFN